MLTKKSAKIVIAIVLSAALLAAATVSFIIFSVPKDNADAAISAASSFNYLSNGAKYFYSNSNGSVNSVTVNSSAAKGSQSNPHVIHSSNQWIFFSNLINANNSSFNSSSVFFFIDNDLDFAGNSLNPVGSSASGFKATLFGGKHSFKNARFNAVNDTANSAISVSGMFYLLNGAKIYDISIANSCTYSFALNKHTYVGTVAGYSNSASLTNVSSFANVTVNNGASSALNLQIQVGGLIGQCISGTLNVYLSTYKGVITTTAGKENSGSSYPDNQIFCGGVIGYIAAGTAGFTIDGCYINITTVQHHGGLCTGSVYGNGSNNIPATAVFKLLNTIIKSNFTKDGNLTSADMGGINGYNGGLTFNTAPVMQNVYSIGSPDWRNVPATKTNVVTNVSISGTTNAGSEKGVYDKAKTNSSITAKFDFLPDGTPVPKFAPGTYSLSYDLGGGSWTQSSAAAKSYNSSFSATTISQLGTKPTKTGYTFKGWSLKPDYNGTMLSSNQIPANTSGNRTIYAIWTLNDFTGNPSNTTIVYGANATLSSSGVTSPAGTGTTGVTYKYQWKDNSSSHANISGATGSTYALTKPTVSKSGTYQVVITATPKDGRTPAKSVTKNVVLTVQRAGVAVPTGNTSLVYNGSAQTGVAAGSLYNISGNTGTNAGSYNATLTLKDTANYTWGANGANDTAQKTVSWKINKATVAVPTLTLGTFTYDGTAKTPTITCAAHSSCTPTAQTNAGSYTVNVTLTDPVNYKWATAPAGGESAAYPVTWTINKANVTLTAPNITNSVVYVGQTLSALALTGGSAVRAGSTVAVAGVFAWKTGSTKVLDSSTFGVALFTPTDTTNYNTAEINVAFKPVQLYVNVYEIGLEFVTDADTNLVIGANKVVRDVVQYKVDHGSSFTFASGITQTLGNYVGYTKHYYQQIISSTNTGSNEYQDASISNIIANQRVYIDYVANEVEYEVYHIRQKLDQSAMTPADIAKLNAEGLKENLVEKVVLKAKAGSVVTSNQITAEGFTFARRLTGNGVNYDSSYQNRFILGDGSTKLYMYYSRNTYQISWDANGGMMQESGNPSDSITLMYGEEIPMSSHTAIYEDGSYTFVAWYMDYELTQEANLITVPARNVTFYASWSVETFSITYRNNFPSGSTNQVPAVGNPAEYSAERLLAGAIVFTNPSVDGYNFLGWYINGTRYRSISRGMTGNLTLEGRWEAATYTVKFDPNGGKAVRPSSTRVQNTKTFGSGSGLNGQLPVPTRDGYTFDRWTLDKEGNVPVTASTTANLKDNTTVLYAQWEAVGLGVKYSDSKPGEYLSTVVITYTNADGVKEELEISEFDVLEDMFHVGDIITITVKPISGYEVASLTIAGARINNGQRYTVKSKYDDNTISINATLRLATYNITYVLDGGKRLDETKFPYQFTVEDTLTLPDETNVARLGYEFAGWRLGSKDGEPIDQVVDISSIFDYGDEVTDIILVCAWDPAEVLVVLHNNYKGPDGSQNEFTIELQGNRTGDKITIDADNGSFIPQNRELVGWAYTPDGDVVYPVSSYNPDGSPVLSMEYTVTAQLDEDGVLRNHLYAIWRLADVQYLTFTVTNNFCSYSPADDFAGVTLKAHPRFEYLPEATITLTYSWYKVDVDTWEKWTEADLEGVTPDTPEYRAIQTKLGTYKIPANATVYKRQEFTANATEEVFLNIKSVKDSGLYICLLEASGSNITVSNSTATSVTSGVGQYEIGINKADFEGLSLEYSDSDSAYADYKHSVDYDGIAHSLIVALANGCGATWNDGNIVLPDGSILNVTYKYTLNAHNGETVEGTVTDAGSYTAFAEFEFVLDNGNYNLPEELISSIDIWQKVIENVTFEMQYQDADGEWKKVVGDNPFENNVYTRKGFRVVALSSDFVTGDDVTITMFIDGNFNGDYPVNVGEYTAYCDNLGGEKASCYVLGSDLPNQEFNISKATHDIDITFDGLTVTYDKATHELRLTRITENGEEVEITENTDNTAVFTLSNERTVTVTYSLEYTPYNNDFISANRTARGGIDAGLYVVTATFTDTEDNSANFNKIADVTARLTINPASYELSAEELNNIPDGNVEGFGGNHSVGFDVSASYKPHLVLDSNFSVTYKYEKYDDANGQFGAYEYDETRGLRDPGRYRITATVIYATKDYANNYREIANQAIEFGIAQGEIDSITVNYNQGSTVYTYGDEFNFLHKTGGKYDVEILVNYTNGQSETVDNKVCEFYNESGEKFTAFDRANANGNKDYVIRVTCYGADIKDADSKIGSFSVTVSQAKLNGANVTFNANTSLTQGFTDVDWKYAFVYDGNAHFPTVAGADTAFNFINAFGEVATDCGIRVVYTYRAKDATEFVAMPDGGLKDAGEYVLRVNFTHSNPNYADAASIDKYFELAVKITPKTLTDKDIVWEYHDSGEGDAAVWKEVPESGLEYRFAGYTLRAKFNGLAHDGTIAISDINLEGSASVKVTDAGSYNIKAKYSGNYVLDVTAVFTVNPKKVDAVWVVGTTNIPLADYKFIYSSENQISSITVYYLAVEDGNAKVTATSVIADKAFVNAGSYTLTAEFEKGNYEVRDNKATVTIAPYDMENTESSKPITWQFRDSDGLLKDITEEGLEYKGGSYEIYAKFEGLDGTDMTVAAHTISGREVKKVGGYVLLVGVDGNYNIKGECNFVINPKEIEVLWKGYNGTGLIYNGQERELSVDALGVGTEAGKTIVTLNGHTALNASVKGSDGEYIAYIATAVVADEYAGDYTLKNATLQWIILPATIEVDWSNTTLTYNGYVLSVEATAKSDSLFNGDTVTFTYEVKKGEDIVANNEIIGAGNYTITITGVSDNNYTIIGSQTANTDVTVNKARPNISDVKYTEYEQGSISYTSNDSLRNDKLVCTHDVAGTIKFADNRIITSGNRSYQWVFEPEDSDNYSSVQGTVMVEIIVDNIVGLDVDTSRAIKYWTVNSTYHIGTVEVYLKYASYYTETDSEGNVVHKGKRENITGAEFDKITFMINGALAEGYTLSENDVPSCKVDVSYRYGGNNYFGEYYLTVNTARPSAISINGIDDYLNAKYYVGGKLDISKMTFTVKFQGFADGTIDASAVTYDLGALNLPTTEGPYTITFRYFDVSTTLTINVLPKEEIAVKFESKTYKYTGEEIKIVVTQDNGQPLPEGITYQFVDKHGNVITSLKEIGEYELTVKFTVDESVYLPIADVSATISVKKIAAMLDESKLIKPVDKRVYNGEQFPYELDGISIIEENGDTEYKFINVTYTITRDGKPVTELVVDKAGVYKIVAKIQFEAVTGELAGETQFLEKEYTITVDRAKNEIFSFKIDSWIVDTAQKDPVINAKFGTANIVYFTSEGVELGVTRPSSLGNYYAIATIPSCESYDEVTARCDFSINKASIGAVDDEGNELVDETGKPKYEVTGENGVDPSLTFKVEKWADDYDSSYVKVNRKLMVVAGYGICFVDGEGKEVFVEGTHTVRILIDEALRNEKKLYIYTVDEQGNVIDLDARREGDYLVFDTDDFSKDFVVACRDAAAAQRMGLIIGVSVGAIIAIAVVIALIVVFVKKKKEND